MRIRIDASPLGALSILSELPNARLATLEGLNGIGKTLAVRLLQLCTGTMPYRSGSAAWDSLCDGLGDFRVTVSDLAGADEIIWEGDSRSWMDTDANRSPSAVVPFERITIDGSPVSMDQIRRLLVVHRIAGDEGIIDTFAQQADAAADTVARWRRRVAAEEKGPLASLETAVEEASLLLGQWTAARYVQLRATDRDAARQLQKVEEAAKRAEERRDELRTASDLRHQLQEFQERAPDLEQQLERIDQRISTVRAAKEGLERRVAELAATVVRAEPTMRELDNARRTLKRNQSRLRLALMSAAGAAAPLEIEPHETAVRDLIARTEVRIEQLVEQQTTLDAAPAMRDLLDELSDGLSSAEGRGLGDQVAIDDPDSDIQLTVSQTRIGMLSRRAFLVGQPPPPQTREVTAQLKAARLTLARAKNLEETLGSVRRFERLVRENEQRIDSALAEVRPAAVSEVQRLEQQRRAHDEQLLKLAVQRAALRQQFGAVADGATEPELSAQLHDALDRAGVTLAELDHALRNAEAAATTEQDRLRDAQEALASSRRAVAHVERDARLAATALAKSPQWEWLHAAMSQEDLPGEGSTTQQQLQTLDGLRQVLEAIVDRLGRHRQQFGGVESALRGVSRHLHNLDPQAAEYVPQLQAWLGNRFSSWFNNPRIRHELLPAADGDIAVQLESREVVWVEGTLERSRPLEAFSSGEQAFAYTRARLAVLDEEEPRQPNRLIVLDEFGAFIAHDRLAALLAYFQERAEEHGEDQVLVILPLSRDYAQMAATAIGTDSDRLHQLAEQVSASNYAVQVLL